MNRVFWCLLLLLIAPAHAERDIVYAARYYNPPGSHRTSHFHLYRINPNGTGRTQLTYGSSDDICPQWSPDGRQILFLRGERTVCVSDADGRGTRTLAEFGGVDLITDLQWLPNGRSISFVHYHDVGLTRTSALWLLNVHTGRARRFAGAREGAFFPDGRWLLIAEGAGGCQVVDLRTGAVTRLPDVFEAVWLTHGRLVAPDEETPLRLHLFNINTKQSASITMRPPTPDPWDLAEGEGDLLQAPQHGTVIYALNEHNSTVGVLAAFFRVNLSNGTMRFLAQGQFLTWSPDGKRYCTAPGRDTWTYDERKWDGTDKTVWAAPLQVGPADGKLRTITPGLVWVTGADWRKQ